MLLERDWNDPKFMMGHFSIFISNSAPQKMDNRVILEITMKYIQKNTASLTGLASCSHFNGNDELYRLY